MSLPNPLRKQNEFISILQKQLRATERDLADQKWIHEQYLNSPSWKLTAPLRWTARRLRALRAWIIRRSPEKSENLTPRSDAAVNEDREDQAAGPGEDNLTVQEFNELYAPSYWVALQSLLASDAVLDLPAAAEPAVSIILVLSDHAELSMACLRSIRENVPEKFDLVIVDNASSGLVQNFSTGFAMRRLFVTPSRTI